VRPASNFDRSDTPGVIHIHDMHRHLFIYGTEHTDICMLKLGPKTLTARPSGWVCGLSRALIGGLLHVSARRRRAECQVQRRDNTSLLPTVGEVEVEVEVEEPDGLMKP
jgi:hypothetical protein